MMVENRDQGRVLIRLLIACDTSREVNDDFEREMTQLTENSMKEEMNSTHSSTMKYK